MNMNFDKNTNTVKCIKHKTTYDFTAKQIQEFPNTIFNLTCIHDENENENCHIFKEGGGSSSDLYKKPDITKMMVMFNKGHIPNAANLTLM